MPIPIQDRVRIIEVCAICGDSTVVRLLTNWQDRVHKGATIPIIGCGNPWHYEGMQGYESFRYAIQ